MNLVPIHITILAFVAVAISVSLIGFLISIGRAKKIFPKLSRFLMMN